jgi:hypothetical protein
MRFLKINNQHAVNTELIQQLKVTGHEQNCHLCAVMSNGDMVILSRHISFPSAEVALRDLMDTLERS